MLLQELNDLKEGDQVVFNGNPPHVPGHPIAGTILTRSKNWMDDDMCVKFNYGSGHGLFECHYFSHNQVDFIETGIKE